MREKTNGGMMFLTYFFTLFITNLITSELGLNSNFSSDGVNSQTIIMFIIKIAILFLVLRIVKYLLIEIKKVINKIKNR